MPRGPPVVLISRNEEYVLIIKSKKKLYKRNHGLANFHLGGLLRAINGGGK